MKSDMIMLKSGAAEWTVTLKDRDGLETPRYYRILEIIFEKKKQIYLSINMKTITRYGLEVKKNSNPDRNETA